MKTAVDNRLASPFPLREEFPRTLISLWDMFYLFDTCDFLWSLDRLRVWVKTAEIHVGEKKGDASPDVATWKVLLELVSKVQRSCERLQMQQPVLRILEAKLFGFKPESACSYRSIAKDLNGILLRIDLELSRVKFAFLSADKAHFFEREDLFGKSFHQNASAEINAEIKAAGNCLAADLHTAAVFHVMCVVEYGLRRLALRLKVKSVKKSIPLELGTWNDIITELQKEVDERVPRANAKGQKQLNAYSELLVEFRAFEIFWRNKVAHSRARYSESDANNAFEHVSRFMKVLATQVPLR